MVALAKAWQTRPEMVAGRMPPAPPRGTQATGSWEKTRPADQQLPWRWSSNWPGQRTPPSPRSGHLTQGKLTNASALGAPAAWCDPEGVMTLQHTRTCCTYYYLAPVSCAESQCFLFFSRDRLMILHLNSHFSGCMTPCHGYCTACSQERLL